jgi:hypothetical protein
MRRGWIRSFCHTEADPGAGSTGETSATTDSAYHIARRLGYQCTVHSIIVRERGQHMRGKRGVVNLCLVSVAPRWVGPCLACLQQTGAVITTTPHLQLALAPVSKQFATPLIRQDGGPASDP